MRYKMNKVDKQFVDSKIEQFLNEFDSSVLPEYMIEIVKKNIRNSINHIEDDCNNVISKDINDLYRIFLLNNKEKYKDDVFYFLYKDLISFLIDNNLLSTYKLHSFVWV